MLFLATVAGGLVLWGIRPRAVASQPLLDPAEAQSQVSFALPIPAYVPAGARLRGVIVQKGKASPSGTVAGSSSARAGVRSNRNRGIGVLLAGGKSGARIREVVVGSPAAEAGLQPGDLIVALDGRHTGGWSNGQLVSALRRSSPIALRLERGGQAHEVAVTPRTYTFSPARQTVSSAAVAEPSVALVYELKGRTWEISRRRLRGYISRWGGAVVRPVGLGDASGTLRRIGGHLAVTWEKAGVLTIVSNSHDALSEAALIQVAASIGDGGEIQ